MIEQLGVRSIGAVAPFFCAVRKCIEAYATAIAKIFAAIQGEQEIASLTRVSIRSHGDFGSKLQDGWPIGLHNGVLTLVEGIRQRNNARTLRAAKPVDVGFHMAPYFTEPWKVRCPYLLSSLLQFVATSGCRQALCLAELFWSSTGFPSTVCRHTRALRA